VEVTVGECAFIVVRDQQTRDRLADLSVPAVQRYVAQLGVGEAWCDAHGRVRAEVIIQSVASAALRPGSPSYARVGAPPSGGLIGSARQ
jgi:hypothetical protein